MEEYKIAKENIKETSEGFSDAYAGLANLCKDLGV
jgi:hypothetical protein